MQGNHLKEILQNLHLYFNKNLPTPKGIYAVEKGVLAGEFLVFVKTLPSGIYSFLSLPKMLKRDITADIFNVWLNKKQIIFVEKLPGHIFGDCLKQYNLIVDKKSK